MKFFAVEMIQEFGTVTNPKIFLKLKQVYLNFVSHIMVKLYSLEWEISTSLAQLLYTKLRKINQEMLWKLIKLMKFRLTPNKSKEWDFHTITLIYFLLEKMDVWSFMMLRIEIQKESQKIEKVCLFQMKFWLRSKKLSNMLQKRRHVKLN